MTDVPDSDDAEGAEATLAAILEGADVDADAATFDAPWQARAFAIAIALIEEGAYDWQAFQERFIERIEATDRETMQEDVEGVYYRQWLETLEDFLEATDLVTVEELDARQAEFEEGERDESEFVVTDRPGGGE